METTQPPRSGGAEQRPDQPTCRIAIFARFLLERPEPRFATGGPPRDLSVATLIEPRDGVDADHGQRVN